MQLLELLVQRRIWAGLFGTISVLLPMFGTTFTISPEYLSEIFTNLFIAISGLITAILPVWSYFRPKK